MKASNRTALPGFAAALSYTALYLTVLVLLPLATLFATAGTLPLAELWAAIAGERALAAYRLTVAVALAAAALNAVLGLPIAWVLVRYRFAGRRILDALIDVPLALPTAVAGLVYANLYVEKGWLGRYLVPWGIEAAYSRLAIVLVLTFIGLPLVVRTLEPVIEGLDAEVEEAAACLGATRLQTLRRIVLPALWPALVTGFALTLARSLGEYGAVVFVSGNMPYRTEIAPVLIVAKLEEFRYAEATAIAVVLLAGSFSLLLLANRLERWRSSHV